MEFALLFPIFFMVCIGTITFGFAFEKWISVTQAAREASRFAATYPNPTGQWFDTVGKAAAENAGITLTGDNATPLEDYYICVQFTQIAIDVTSVSKEWGTLSGVPCHDSKELPDARVDVTVSRAADVNWLFGASKLTMTGSNTSRFEPKFVP